MIVVTRLDRRQFAINPDLIERIQASPDTTLHLADGTTYVVAESMTDIIELIARYRAYVLSVAREMPGSDFGPGSPALTVVRPTDNAAAQSEKTVRLPPRK